MAAHRKKRHSYGGARVAFTLDDWHRLHYARLDRMNRHQLNATAAVRAYLGLYASNSAALETIRTSLQIRGGAK